MSPNKSKIAYLLKYMYCVAWYIGVLCITDQLGNHYMYISFFISLWLKKIMVILFYMYLIQKFCSILYLLKDCYFLLWFSVTCKVTVNYLSQSACFQGCHNLQRMDLEECVLVSIIVQCHLGFREPFQEFKEENEIMFHSCGTKSSFCVNKIVWLFFCPF